MEHTGTVGTSENAYLAKLSLISIPTESCTHFLKDKIDGEQQVINLEEIEE